MLRVISGRRKFVNKALRSCIIHGESHEKNVGCKQGLANIHSNIHELLHVCISTVHKCSGAVRTTELCGNTRSFCYARISFCSLYGVYRDTHLYVYMHVPNIHVTMNTFKIKKEKYNSNVVCMAWICSFSALSEWPYERTASRYRGLCFDKHESGGDGVCAVNASLFLSLSLFRLRGMCCI